jgi:hypothetical protein
MILAIGSAGLIFLALNWLRIEVEIASESAGELPRKKAGKYAGTFSLKFCRETRTDRVHNILWVC